jgi:hypothetical protein
MVLQIYCFFGLIIPIVVWDFTDAECDYTDQFAKHNIAKKTN